MSSSGNSQRIARTTAIVVFVGLLALYLLHEARGVTQSGYVTAIEASVLPDAEPASGPALASLVQNLARSPIHQDEAGLLLAQRLARGDTPQSLRPLAESVGKLGFRSTRAQQSLIQYGLQTEDVDLILDQVDALLRRGKAVDQVLPVLFAIETLPEGREVLINKLTEGAPWRRVFFQSPLGLANSSQLENRKALLSKMLDQGLELSRQDAQPFLLRTVESGQRESAYQFFCRIDERCGEFESIDPEFEVLAERMATNRPELYPFEWSASRGRGFSALPNARSIAVSQTGVLLRWDGRGTPTFLSQVGPYQAFERIAVDTPDAQDFTANFYMEYRCPRAEPIRYELSPQPNPKELAFALPAQPSCVVGTFALVGRFRPQVSGVRVSVNSISGSQAGAEAVDEETG